MRQVRRRVRLLGCIAAVVGASQLQAQRAPMVEGLQVEVPVAPRALLIDGRRHVVYELHLTNFRSAPVELLRIELRAVGRGGVLADYAGDDLARRLGRAGQRRAPETPRIVAPGGRAVAFFWIALPPGAPAPAGVRHRIEAQAVVPGTPEPIVFEGAAAAVSLAAPVSLGPPLRGGPWVAIYDPLLAGGHRTAFYTVDGRARIPGRFAIDLVRLPESGKLDLGSAAHPTDWNGLGSEVLAVADARVVAAVDDMPDNDGIPSTPVRLEAAAGNYVALALPGGQFAFYEHLRHGSVRVAIGQRVRRGQVIGQLGNSGSSSIGPHLHFHVSDGRSPLGAEGVPFVLAAFEQVGAFASMPALVQGDAFTPLEGGTRAHRVLEFPEANAVLRLATGDPVRSGRQGPARR